MDLVHKTLQTPQKKLKKKTKTRACRSAECVDLVRRIFVASPTDRITMDQVRGPHAALWAGRGPGLAALWLLAGYWLATGWLLAGSFLLVSVAGSNAWAALPASQPTGSYEKSDNQLLKTANPLCNVYLTTASSSGA